MNAAREAASSLCIKDLLTRAGHGPNTPVPRKADGSRNWPAPYLGSLTHKGTVVLGALLHRSNFEVCGIDLELLEKHKAPLEAKLISPEGLPAGIDPADGVTCSFSAKEAVFKAQYPVTQKRLGFRDVQILDFKFQGTLGGGSARLDGFPGIPVSVLIVDPWIVSVALLRKNSV